LVCNPTWLATEDSPSLAKLYSSFKGFGRAIGKDNHAVWFWMGNSPIGNSELVRNLDMKRNTHYCLAWRLKLTSGPYLVILSTWPDEKHLAQAFEKNHAIFDLGNMKGPMASDFLAKLADDLVQAYRVNSQAISPANDTEWWYWWLEDARANLDSFSCSWSFKIDAGPAREELHSCGGK